MDNQSDSRFHEASSAAKASPTGSGTEFGLLLEALHVHEDLKQKGHGNTIAALKANQKKSGKLCMCFLYNRCFSKWRKPQALCICSCRTLFPGVPSIACQLRSVGAPAPGNMACWRIHHLVRWFSYFLSPIQTQFRYMDWLVVEQPPLRNMT